jgi:hypothetical protein
MFIECCITKVREDSLTKKIQGTTRKTDFLKLQQMLIANWKKELALLILPYKRLNCYINRLEKKLRHNSLPLLEFELAFLLEAVKSLA